MFTGLIQTLGRIYHLNNSQLRIDCVEHNSDVLLEDIALGDSIAIDGVCLTVEQILTSGFIVTVSPETLERTTLGQLPEGASVNLESSLRVGSKIGGHFVTGHIDGQGTLDISKTTNNAWELRFQVTNPTVSRYIVPKGSIAVNGISLTVADCDTAGSWFTVAVIPVTYQETTLHHLSPGQLVNLEGDILGKYVERFLRKETEAEGAAADPLSLAFLAEHGYGQ